MVKLDKNQRERAKHNRGLIRITEHELLEALQLPRDYKVVALRMVPLVPVEIRITVEHESLPVHQVGKPLVEVERSV